MGKRVFYASSGFASLLTLWGHMERSPFTSERKWNVVHIYTLLLFGNVQSNRLPSPFGQVVPPSLSGVPERLLKKEARKTKMGPINTKILKPFGDRRTDRREREREREREKRARARVRARERGRS